MYQHNNDGQSPPVFASDMATNADLDNDYTVPTKSYNVIYRQIRRISTPTFDIISRGESIIIFVIIQDK